MALRYEADLERADGTAATFTYQRSERTIAHGIGCAVTGIFYGGWCWVYLLMPFSSDLKETKDLGRKALKKRLGNQRYHIVAQSVYRHGWNDGWEFARLTDADGNDDDDEPRDEGTTESPVPEPPRSRLGNLHLLVQPTRLPTRHFFAGLDAGTSFSPNGVGPIIGFELGSFRTEFGYGLFTKNEQLGQAWSASLFYNFMPGLYFGGGMTRYTGHGTRKVLYRGGDFSEDHIPASWSMNYARASIGTYLQRLSRSALRVFGEVGLAANVYTRIAADDGSDYSNLGRPTGIDIEKNHFNNNPMMTPTGAGEGDYGLYVRIGTYYLLY